MDSNQPTSGQTPYPTAELVFVGHCASWLLPMDTGFAGFTVYRQQPLVALFYKAKVLL